MIENTGKDRLDGSRTSDAKFIFLFENVTTFLKTDEERDQKINFHLKGDSFAFYESFVNKGELIEY